MVLALNGLIPTNTTTFQKYAFELMITNAQSIALVLRWDRSSITTNRVTEFWARPTVTGVQGGMCFDRRYGFSYRNGRFAGCSDLWYDDGFVNSGDPKRMRAVVRKWLKEGDRLSRESARRMAESTLRSLGVAAEETSLRFAVDRQLIFDDPGKESISLPYYIFCWKSQTPAMTISSNQAVYATAEVHVSGVAAHVAQVTCQTGEISVSGRSIDVRFGLDVFPCLRMTRPTNYMEMLGLPADTIFVRRKPVGNHLSDEQPVYEIFPTEYGMFSP